MTRQYKNMGGRTLDAIRRLHRQGIRKISVILRHSERSFSDDPDLEPFMSLTDPGKQMAFDFGKNLVPSLVPALYASYMGRCIETAYLVDKGFTTLQGPPLPHTGILDELSPFYLKDIDRVIEGLRELGDHCFLRKWFDREIDTGIMEDPVLTADTLCRIMTTRLNSLDHGQVAICVSHDWNIYPIKEFKLNLPHESAGDVGYLEGVLFFKDKGDYFVMGIDQSPVLLDISAM